MRSNWVYIVWFIFYFILFSVLTFGVAIPFYLVTVPLAFSPLAEKLWRKVSGVRPLRINREKDCLLPLFKEVYEGAITEAPYLSKGIKLYIKEDMSINAFAFGKSTLVLTRGSIELMDDDCLKGFIAHEFGHFSNFDTTANLFATVSNLFMSVIMKKLTDIKNGYDEKEGLGIFQSLFKFLFDVIYYFFRGIQFLGDLILMHISRQHEYMADIFALDSGYGESLVNALLQIYDISVEKPKSVKEQMKSSHPHVTLRIELLEKNI